MPKIEKTIFISYRRTDVYTALAVDQSLKNKGYDVFFDYTSISSGDFEQIIISNIKARAHFILILTPTALDRCSEPGDWLRREIETAIHERRNIIPLFFKGFSFSSPAVIENLTGGLKNLNRYNGLNIHEDYFYAGMDRLHDQFLSIPLNAVLHPIPVEVQEVVAKEQAAANKDAGLINPGLLTNDTFTKPEIEPKLTTLPPTQPHMEVSDASGKGLLVFVTDDNVALRANPSIGASLSKRLTVGTELHSLESESETKAKIGGKGQWLHVQDPAGDQGYVAAWFITAERELPKNVFVSNTGLPPGALAFEPKEEISFRSEPIISPETLIRRVPVSETLISIEPANQAIPKVGVIGQWLKVRDRSNQEGYVAAWYVKYASSSQPGATAVAPHKGHLQVRATAEGIALRSQPVVSDATLIKRLPMGTVFIVLEPNAEGKIGRNDQWLRVRDPAGMEGYVAAFFVAS
jgi:hypothetical protein